MTSSEAKQYEDTPYAQPNVPGWLKIAVQPLVELNHLYQFLLDRSFKLFELLAKPFFELGMKYRMLIERTDQMALGLLFIIFFVYTYAK